MIAEDMAKTISATAGPRLPDPQLSSVVNNWHTDTTLPSAATNTCTMLDMSLLLAHLQRFSQNPNQPIANAWTSGQQNGLAATEVRPKTKAR